jgi:hypothetical protein
MQYVMFQHLHPEGSFECPCGATSERGEYQSLGYQGWFYPQIIKHFQYEGQRVIAICPSCNLTGPGWREKREVWRFKPELGEILYRWLDRLYKSNKNAPS